MRLPSHVILVGLPGAGKTTVGSMLARSLDCPFIDLDAEIVRHTGRSISAHLCRAWRTSLPAARAASDSRLRDAPQRVVAPGGGWVTVAATVALLRPPARMAYLKVSPAEAARRLGRAVQSRPLLRHDPLVSSSVCWRQEKRPTWPQIGLSTRKYFLDKQLQLPWRSDRQAGGERLARRRSGILPGGGVVGVESANQR